MQQPPDVSFIEKAISPMGEGFTFLFLIIVVIAFIIWLFRKDISGYLQGRTPNREFEELKHHTVFLTAENFPKKVNTIDFTTFDCYDETKSKLLKKLLEFKSKAVINKLKTFLDKPKLKEMNAHELRTEVAHLLSELIEEYNEEAYRYYVNELHISSIDARFLIDKYEAYRMYMVEGFGENVEAISVDPFIDSNFMKINSIFYLIALALEAIPNDVERVFNDVNGRFKKYEKAS